MKRSAPFFFLVASLLVPAACRSDSAGRPETIGRPASLAGPGARPQFSLTDVWRARPASNLGSVAALEPTSTQAVARRALDTRARLVDGGGRSLRPAASGPDALAACEVLTTEQHRQRVQGIAAWTAPNASEREPYRGRVVEVINAKTFMVAPLEGGEPTRVALYGVQVPYDEQAFGPVVQDWVGDLLAERGNEVTVIEVTANSRGSYALVLVGDADGAVEPLGELAMRHGYAWWNERYAGLDRRLAGLFRAAREARLGCFADPAAISPLAFSTARRAAREGYVFQGEVVRARVVEVTDGDTLDVRLRAEDVERLPALEEFVGEGDRERVVTIRLAGVDTPEIDQPGGVQAWAISHLVCADERVDVILLDDGGYGRLAGRVIAPGRGAAW